MSPRRNTAGVCASGSPGGYVEDGDDGAGRAGGGGAGADASAEAAAVLAAREAEAEGCRSEGAAAEGVEACAEADGAAWVDRAVDSAGARSGALGAASSRKALFSGSGEVKTPPAAAATTAPTATAVPATAISPRRR
ncbi:hypothetical protein [Streptomyces tsukubensis]|uniref:hypothetical protein n=1 Tax=Streptomyces tsukubensis TaxID=83656 RepID=UPI0015C3F699|nr:hypothetical protein [Streptomyces tsukubensis]